MFVRLSPERGCESGLGFERKDEHGTEMRVSMLAMR
jgi:hypothetical protein